MSTPATRRRALPMATAAVGTLDALPYARKAEASETLGPIEATYHEYLHLMDGWDSAVRESWRIEDDLYEEPPRPVWHPGTCEGGYKLQRIGGEKCRVFLSDDPKNIDRLRAIIDAPETLGEDDWLAGRRLQRAKRARTELESILAWQAECDRRKDASGLTAAHEAEAGARDAAQAAITSMFAIEAASFRELAFQATHLREDWDQERAEAVIDRLIQLAGIAKREF